MVPLSRRMLLVGLGSLAAGCAHESAHASPAAPPPPALRRLHIDSLCTSATEDEVRVAVAGGVSAAVVDLAIYPREPQRATEELAAWAERFRSGAEPITLVRVAADIEAAQRAGHLGVILGCQDASILGPPTGSYDERLSMFHALGLRVLQVTHNERNPWGDSFMEVHDGGLSHAGEDLVKAMNERRMVIDLSHCSRQTLLDAVALSTLPCAVTHAGCYALARTARDKRDDEIRALGAKGGYFGVFDMGCWLAETGPATIKDVVAHIDHAVGLIGPEQVGLGTDGAVSQLDAAAELARMQHVQQLHAVGPSFEWPIQRVRVPELNAANRFDALAQALASRGYGDPIVRGILGGNFARFFGKVCG